MRITIIAVCLCLIGQTTLCQQVNREAFLVAQKNNKEVVFKKGSKFLITYWQNGEVKQLKSFFKDAAGDSILLVSKKGEIANYIALDSVQTIRKINPRFRMTMGVLGGLGFAVGVAYLSTTSKNSNPDAGYAALLVVPAFVLFTISAITIPISLIQEKSNEKSTKKGWRFFIQYK